MTKSIIAPIVSAIILVLQNVFGLSVPEEVGGQITDAIVSIASGLTLFYGLYKQFKLRRQKRQNGDN